MTIEPALVRTDRDRDAYNTACGDDKLSDETRNRIFESRDASSARSHVSHMTPALCYPSAALR
jgi:hypothetical protein